MVSPYAQVPPIPGSIAADGPASPAALGSQRDLSALGVIAVLVHRWRPLLLAPLVLAFITGLATFLLRPIYTATVAFVPEEQKGISLPAALGGLAGQLGLQLPGVGAERSPQFYAVLAQSREVMDTLLLGRYPATHAPRYVTVRGDSLVLLDLIVPKRELPLAERLYRARRKLRGELTTSVDIETSIVRARVGMPSPTLAADVATKLFRELEAFNLDKRQVTARARRQFVEQRVEEAGNALERAEAALRAFLQRNRRYEGSPELNFEHQRLDRAVQLRQDLYLSLARELETSRIGEVNDTPTLTLLEAAQPPVRKSKPRRVLLAAAAMLVGFAGALLWVGWTEYRARMARAGSEDLAALQAAMRRARGQARALFRVGR